MSMKLQTSARERESRGVGREEAQARAQGGEATRCQTRAVVGKERTDTCNADAITSACCGIACGIARTHARTCIQLWYHTPLLFRSVRCNHTPKPRAATSVRVGAQLDQRGDHDGRLPARSRCGQRCHSSIPCRRERWGGEESGGMRRNAEEVRGYIRVCVGERGMGDGRKRHDGGACR